MSLENLSADDITRLAAVQYQLLDNPETRKETLRLQKKVNPNVHYPELEIDERFKAQQDASDAKIFDLQAKIQERDLKQLREEKHRMLLDRGLAGSSEEIAQIEQFAIDNGVGDYEKAARFFQLEKQAATPTYETGYQPPKPVIPKDFDASKTGFRKAAHEALDEFRKMNKSR